ncbi:hypothetical protein [Winogradskyella sp. KYW1333]|uniref:hypothetical protein n=1 Tax=Winogradskyella sp. KYW1333 TaxID=2282123 RepID=UPI000DF23066|nr:hypothetical protein [Winogradskyella sp. KYW1333]RCT55871.1 hypothetical protein DUZ96_01975 [Winogradskyella sp. KYW1333]
MKKTLSLLLSFVLFCFLKSCGDSFEPTYTEQSEQSENQDIVTSASGVQYPSLDPPSHQYCGPGWGRKFCRFLSKYDGTIWTDAGNYYSDFSDIKLSNFSGNEYFISFFNLDSITSYCDGWKLGETTNNGIKWNIRTQKDEVDRFWFAYEYYGSSEEIEYTVTHKYEVIDGLLHFSTTDGQTFIFTPSERNYTEEFLDTNEIIYLEGCIF